MRCNRYFISIMHITYSRIRGLLIQAKGALFVDINLKELDESERVSILSTPLTYVYLVFSFVNYYFYLNGKEKYLKIMELKSLYNIHRFSLSVILLGILPKAGYG